MTGSAADENRRYDATQHVARFRFRILLPTVSNVCTYMTSKIGGWSSYNLQLSPVAAVGIQRLIGERIKTLQSCFPNTIH
jgi:hypothetical protein